MLATTVDSHATARPIVGRDLELGHLEQTLDALDRGSAACLTVEGEPGIGKTRLLGALRGRAERGAGALADERYRAHRAVRRLMELIAGEQPLVLVLDDLHWSDGASVELIAALVRRPPAAPVLLALGMRPGQAPERLSSALAARTVRRLELGPLSEAEAAQMLQSADAETVAAIYEHAGGNPFYLEQ